MTYYRVQSADRDVADLLDPAEQVSRSWDGRGDEPDHRGAREGVSVCRSLEELATYLATQGTGIPYGLGEWVIVALDGPQSEATPLDYEYGERLVHPEVIESVTPLGEEFFEMIGAAYEATGGEM